MLDEKDRADASTQFNWPSHPQGAPGLQPAGDAGRLGGTLGGAGNHG